MTTMSDSTPGPSKPITALPAPLRRADLDPIARSLADAFATATPFPHIVIDHFLDEVVATWIAREFPEADGDAWQRFRTTRERKLALSDVEEMGPITRAVIEQLNGQVFIEFLERVTGIAGLVGDTHLLGGGLHQIGRGGHLAVHADFNRHEHLRLDRRLNLLLYLNRDWPDSFGGHLELWDRSMGSCRRSIAPVAGRLVLFATTDDALHGHPDPLRCPETRARRSIALYYYSNGRPETEVNAPHSTLFRVRRDTGRVKQAGVWAADRLAPPVFVDLARRVRQRSASER